MRVLEVPQADEDKIVLENSDLRRDLYQPMPLHLWDGWGIYLLANVTPDARDTGRTIVASDFEITMSKQLHHLRILLSFLLERQFLLVPDIVLSPPSILSTLENKTPSVSNFHNCSGELPLNRSHRPWL